MKMELPLSKADLMLLRNSSIVFAALTALAITIYVGASGLQRSATANLNSSRAYFDQVSTSVTQIAQEEETIIRYIDRYVRIAADGIVSPQDRLQFLERMTNIRDEYQLYSMNLTMDELVNHVVPYPPEDPLPGDPVTITQTAIGLELSLLHEGDLIRLLDELMRLPGLYQPTACSMELDAGAAEGFNQLRENLLSRCQINWYSFDLTPPENPPEEGF